MSSLRLLLAAGLLASAITLAAAAPSLPSAQVAWLAAATDAEVDAAFRRARAERKPVLLYWGASWCPPCNRLKATLFNRQDFSAQAKAFVAVHVDGDRPGAQKLGERFRTRGYPSLLLMAADGREIVRLPGEAAPEQVMDLLRLGLAGGRPVKAVLADARAGRSLNAAEWRQLSFYAWDQDEERLVGAGERADLLAELARRSAAADAESQTRLWLKALAASDDAKGLKPDDPMRQRLLNVLADPQATRAQFDVLVYGADAMAKVLAESGTPERLAWIGRFDAVLARAQADATLARADRVSALIGRIDLQRLDQPRDAIEPKLPAALVEQTRDLAARFDREVSDGYERQAVITALGYALAQAGLWAESDRLLAGNLSRSHSPYYLMSQLSSNARKLGRKDEALRWSLQAWERSEGPATRLQWGASYLSALVDLAPADAVRIEQAASRLFAEAGADTSAFHERSARSLERASRRLLAWNKDGSKSAAIARLQAQLDAICRKAPAADGQRGRCEKLLKGAGDRAA
jgi:thioredoxin-like negative regulator of GroEL